MLGVLSIALAGALSGSLQEFVNHHVEPLEKLNDGFCTHSQQQRVGTWRAWKTEATKAIKLQRQEPPSLRQLFSPYVMLPSAIGFLAYEYGKEILLQRDEE